MARIRTVKPEFWTDGKIDRLSDSAALFFIGLWNHCDDYGFFTWDHRELSLKLPRWTPQATLSLLSKLSREGLVRLSTESRVGLVIGWHHQKIKDRRASDWIDKEILWDAPEIDTPGSEKNGLGKDRIGRDRIGEDTSGEGRTLPAANLELGPPEKQKKSGAHKPATAPTWEAYSLAYHDKYGTDPVRNLTVNSQLAQFVRRLGVEEAPHVAKFYLTHRDSFYAKNLHPVGLMLRDAEKLRTEWKTNTQVTSSTIRVNEKTQHALSQLERINREELELKQQEGA